MYEIEGLKDGIERCKINIKIFEAAIEKEFQTIAEYNQMIEFLEKQAEREKKQDGNSGRSNS